MCVASTHPRGRYYADSTVDVAIEGKADGVVAIGLRGSEAGQLPEWFGLFLGRVRAADLHSVPNAGETVGPESVGDGANRSRDAGRRGSRPRRVPGRAPHLLEVCPTSNLRLGVPPNYASQPLPRLLAADIHLTVNSDDPQLFNTTFKDEAALLPEPFGFGLGEIDELILNGVRHSFLLPQRKQDIEPTFRAELDAPKESQPANR